MNNASSSLTDVGALTPGLPISPWLIAPLVAMAAFMEVLDTTIANVALPHIAGAMATTVDESTWVLTSYLVANAIVLPLNGFFSAVFGRKKYFMGCVAIFTLSSLLVGMAPSFPLLIICRVFQGLGGGGLQPGAQAILRDTFPPEKIGAAMAVYGIVVVVGPVLGPLLGGWITDNYTWRWCFLINVPIGIVLLFSLFILLPEPAHQRRVKISETGMDYIGLGLVTLGLACLQIMMDRGQDADWFASPAIRTLALFAVLGLVCGFIWEWYEPHPIINFRLLKDSNFGLATLGMFIFGGVLYSTTTLLPLMVQTLMGYDAKQAGMVLAPGGMVVFCLMPLVGFLVPRIATRWLITFGILVNVLALMMMGSLSLSADFGALAWCRAVQGLGLAFLFVPFNTAAFGFVPRDRISDASGILNLARNIGGSVGISAAIAFVANNSQRHQNFLVANVTASSPIYLRALHGLAGILHHAGLSTLHALHVAQAVLYARLRTHAYMLGYMDAYHDLAILFLLVIPVAMLLRTPSFKKSASAVVE